LKFVQKANFANFANVYERFAGSIFRNITMIILK